MDEWEVDKPLGQCYGSGITIGKGQEYFAALVETKEGLQRRDFCVDYWQEQKPQVYCYWKSKFPDPEDKKQVFVDDEMLMSFFERLGQEREQEKINFRFVLALILMRKRRLKYDSSGKEGSEEIWRLRIVGENRSVEVVNPQLDEQRIEELSSQLSQILHTNL